MKFWAWDSISYCAKTYVFGNINVKCKALHPFLAVFSKVFVFGHTLQKCCFLRWKSLWSVRDQHHICCEKTYCPLLRQLLELSPFGYLKIRVVHPPHLANSRKTTTDVGFESIIAIFPPILRIRFHHVTCRDEGSINWGKNVIILTQTIWRFSDSF